MSADITRIETSGTLPNKSESKLITSVPQAIDAPPIQAPVEQLGVLRIAEATPGLGQPNTTGLEQTETRKTPKEILEALPPEIRQSVAWIFEAIEIIQDPDYVLEGELPARGDFFYDVTKLEGVFRETEINGDNLLQIAKHLRYLSELKKIFMEKARTKKEQLIIKSAEERERTRSETIAAEREYLAAKKGNWFEVRRRRNSGELAELHEKYFDKSHKLFSPTPSESQLDEVNYDLAYMDKLIRNPLEKFFDSIINQNIGEDGGRTDIAREIKTAIFDNLQSLSNEIWGHSYFTEGDVLNTMSKNATLEVIGQALDVALLPDELRQKIKDSLSKRLKGTIGFFNYAQFLTQEALDNPIVLKYLPFTIPGKPDYLAQEKAFWSYVKNHNYTSNDVFAFLRKNFDRFSEFVIDGKETTLFMEKLAEEAPVEFIKLADRAQWKLTFGEEFVNKLLDALPKAGDEKRNAFTHNEYDRTTKFLQHLVNQGLASLTSKDLGIITEYIKDFGLSKSPLLYSFYSQIKYFEQGVIPSLSREMIDLGVTSVDAIKQSLARLRPKVYSEKEITDLSDFSELDKKFLEHLTGFSTHRFPGGRGSLGQIMADFKANYDAGLVAPIPEGYVSDEINVSEVKIDFDPELIKGDFDVLSREIITAIDNPGKFEDLRDQIGSTLQRKINEITTRLISADGGQKLYMEKTLSDLTQRMEQLGAVEGLDALLVSLLEMRFDKTEAKIVNSIFRQIVFRKIISHQLSPEMMNNLQGLLEGELTPEAILGVVNLVDHVAKAHVLDFTKNNEDGYWSNNVFEKIQASKNKKYLAEIFDSHAINLRNAVADFEVIKTKKADAIKMIPDRGLIGELSGYLADVCYTKVYPLLVKYPNVVPYKFIQGEGEDARFMGSVLVFEVQDSEGMPALLVRALDIPDEGSIDIAAFTENLLDNLQKVAQKRGSKQVLVAGTNGTISNYQMTANYVLEKYVRGHESAKLRDSFAFNGYDITNQTYVARTVSE